MSTWRKISRWEAILVVAGVGILAISMIYSSYLARELSEGERNQASMYVRAQEEISKHAEDYEADLTFYQDIILEIDDIPVLVTDFNDVILYGRSFGAGNDTNMTYLQSQLDKIQQNGPPPIMNTFDGYKIYYKQSRLLTRLTYFPLVQLLLIGTFIAIGFVGLNSTRRAEQNRVWVGMAKETAHQLGTPISAILAWIEHLKESATGEQGEIIHELEKDVERLDLIADRFSKIGSAPALIPTDIYHQLAYSRDYMARRASRKIAFDFPDPDSRPLMVLMNRHLFNWVLENLIRNSLDAMGDSGTISATVYEESGYVGIDISDTGKGIPPSKFKTVFNPGYTTKKRGWGLGLSLARRIIENYHSGRIYVKRSSPDEGTTFTVKLMKA
jgi:signal transduction histidine kinase